MCIVSWSPCARSWSAFNYKKGGSTMASKNVETLRSVHESWNRRDFAGIVRNATEGLAYTDHARSLTLNTRDKFREWTEDWAKAFSDG